MTQEKLTIGRLAKHAGVGVETIRFYERKGLLVQPKKTTAFRYYPHSYIARIRFIKRAQELGFTLAETKELLNLSVSSQSRCGDILEKTQIKIAEIDTKISDLSKIKAALESIKTCCDNPNVPINDCSVLDAFQEEK